MKNRFEDIMSKHSDEELLRIINSKEGDYQPEALEAAMNVAKERNLSVSPKMASDDIKVESTKSRIEDNHTVKKYPALSTIIILLKIFSFLSLLMTVIYIIQSLSKDSTLLEGVIVVYSGLSLSLVFLVFSELIKVFLDIEYNTWRSSTKTIK